MLIYKSLQTIIAIITKSKVIELFCMAICFCKFLMQWCQNSCLKVLWNTYIAAYQLCQRYGI